MLQLQRCADSDSGRRGAILPQLRGARGQRHPQHSDQQLSRWQQSSGGRQTSLNRSTLQLAVDV